MKGLIILFAILQKFNNSDCQTEIAVRFFFDSIMQTEKVEEYKDSQSEFNCKLNIAPSMDSVKKMTPEALRSFRMLLNNEFENVNNVIQLPPLWQLGNLRKHNAIVPEATSISFYYEKLELSTQNTVIFIGLENVYADTFNRTSVRNYMKSHCSKVKCVRLLGFDEKVKPDIDEAHWKEMDTVNTTNFFYFDRSKKIYSQLTWPSNWYYVRSTTDRVLLNIPETNEIVFPSTFEDASTINLKLTSSWKDDSNDKDHNTRWIAKYERLKANLQEEYWTLQDNNQPVAATNPLSHPASTTKILAGKALGIGNCGTVRLAKDLTNLGYFVIKQGKGLKTEYDIHTALYNIANGMRFNGEQRLRIPTPLGATSFGNTFFVFAMSALGPPLGVDEFIVWTRRSQELIFDYIVPQMIIQIYLFHKTGYLHLDIKPDNFMFGPWGQETLIYLADFGSSILYQDDHRCGRRGTLTYMSIDMITNYSHEIGYKDDYESLIYTIFEFLNDDMPWETFPGETQDKEVLAKTVAKIKSEIFDTKTRDKRITMNNTAWSKLLQFYNYISQLLSYQIPNLQHMLDIFDLNKQLPLAAYDSIKEDTANTVIPYLTVETEKEIFGIPRCHWRKYPFYEAEENLPGEFIFDPQANAPKPVVYMLEERVCMITKDALKKKYHAFVDFGIHWSDKSNLNLLYVFLFPGIEEFIAKSAGFQLVLVTYQPIEVVSGLSKYKLFKHNFKFLQLGKDETLLTRCIVDEKGKIQLPNNQLQNGIYATGKVLNVDNSKQDPNSVMEASFANWHLPFLTEKANN